MENKSDILNLNKKLPQIRNYQLLKKLGEGSYGKIYLAKDTKNSSLVALKIIDKTFLEILGKTEEAFIEQYMLIHLKNNNIINLLSCFQTKQKLIFVIEYFKNGNFENYLKQIQNKNGILSYETSKFYLAELLNILLLFQEKNVAHLDLKPGNILLDERLHLKLIDFGTCKIIGKEFDLKSKKFINKNIKKEDIQLIGTAEYVSPEIINKNVINYKSCDIWSFGIIMYELFHGYTPFKGNNEKETIENIKKGKFEINEKLPFEVKDLIKQLLNYNQEERLGVNDIKDIMNHNFFNGINFLDLFNQKVPEKLKKSYSECNHRKNSFIDELYSIDEYDNEIIDNSLIKNHHFINFSCGNDFCVVKFDETLIKFHENYFKI